MKVTIDIPDREWALMVERAESHGLRVAELIRAAINDAIPNRMPFPEQVLHLVRAGFPDARIAERFGVPNNAVKTIRLKAGLPANRFVRTSTPKPPVDPGVSFTQGEAA